MRILVLTHEYPPIGGGGGRVAQDLCEGFARRGHEVQVISAYYDGLEPKEELDKVTIHRIRSGRVEPFRAGFSAMLGYIWASFWVGLGIIKRWKPDLIHVHFAVPAGVSAFALSMVTGTPYVLTAHLGDVPGGVPEKTGKWFRWIFPFTPPIWRRASSVIAVSDFTRQLALKFYNVPVEVIPNGVDLDQIQPGNIRLNSPPTIVFAGRFVPQKNPVMLVRILAELKDLDWRCILIGDGALRPEIEEQISISGLQNRFSLPGWLKPEEVLDLYRESDILLMPSLTEGLPVVGVQAMSMGLALVLSRVGGCVDLVEEGINGYLLDPTDFQGFVKAVRNLVSRPDHLLESRLASRRLASRFDLNIIIDSYLDQFNKAAGTSR